MDVAASAMVWSAWRESGAEAVVLKAITSGEGIEKAGTVMRDILSAAISKSAGSGSEAGSAGLAARAAAGAVLIGVSLEALRALAAQSTLAPLWALGGSGSWRDDEASDVALLAQSAAGCVEAGAGAWAGAVAGAGAGDGAGPTSSAARELALLVRSLVIGPPALDCTACADPATAALWIRFASAAVRSVRIALWGDAALMLARDALFSNSATTSAAATAAATATATAITTNKTTAVDEVVFAAHSVLAAVAAGAALLSPAVARRHDELDFILSLVIGPNNQDTLQVHKIPLPWAKHLRAAAYAAKESIY